MKKIIIRNQAELDALPDSFDVSTSIEIRSSEIIKVTKTYSNATVNAHDSSTVTVHNSATVDAYDLSRVYAYGLSRVDAYGLSRVDAYGSSRVYAYNESNVIVKNSECIIDAYDDVFVRCGEYNPNIFCEESVTVSYYTPKKVTQDEWLSRGHIYADGILSVIESHKILKDIEIFKTHNGYVVKRGETYSHGDTVEKAIEDLRYKIADRDTSKYNHWKENIDKKYTINELIKGYRVITGACEQGVKQFVESLGDNLKTKMSLKDVLELTKDKYGHDKLKEFLKDDEK